jgi:hypothetical protein
MAFNVRGRGTSRLIRRSQKPYILIEYDRNNSEHGIDGNFAHVKDEFKKILAYIEQPIIDQTIEGQQGQRSIDKRVGYTTDKIKNKDKIAIKKNESDDEYSLYTISDIQNWVYFKQFMLTKSGDIVNVLDQEKNNYVVL